MFSRLYRSIYQFAIFINKNANSLKNKNIVMTFVMCMACHVIFCIMGPFCYAVNITYFLGTIKSILRTYRNARA